MNMQVTPATKRTSKMDVINRFDTTTDTLPNGEERCDWRYKDIDDGDDFVTWARCTRPAAMRILVDPNGELFGLANATYTPLPDGVYEAKSRRECYEQQVAGFGEIEGPCRERSVKRNEVWYWVLKAAKTLAVALRRR